jgi:hypothetical protein
MKLLTALFPRGAAHPSHPFSEFACRARCKSSKNGHFCAITGHARNSCERLIIFGARRLRVFMRRQLSRSLPLGKFKDFSRICRNNADFHNSGGTYHDFENPFADLAVCHRRVPQPRIPLPTRWRLEVPPHERIPVPFRPAVIPSRRVAA